MPEKPASVEVSNLKADELAIEQIVESESALLESASEGELTTTAPVTSSVVPTDAQVRALEKDQITVEVENILEKGLKDVYGNLPDRLKPLFKTKGEETAKTISEMIKSTALKVGDVMKLIYNWLRIIPGLNRYFLEQEAKIKADRIIVLSQEILKDKNLK